MVEYLNTRNKKPEAFLKGTIKRPSLWIQAAIVAVTLIAVAVAIFLADRSYHRNRQSALDQFNQQQLILARSAASGLETLFTEMKAALFSAGTVPSVQLMTPDCLTYMRNMTYGFLPKTSIRRLDEHGNLRFIYPDDGWREKLIGKNYEREDFFQKARETGDVKISRIITNEQGMRRVRIASPVFVSKENDERRRVFKGVLVVSFNLSTIAETFTNPIVTGKTGYAWLINQDGLVIAYHEDEFLGLDAFKIWSEKKFMLSSNAIETVRQNIMQGKASTGQYVSGRHRGDNTTIEKLIAYEPVKALDQTWAFVVVVPAREVDETIRAASTESMYGFGFIAFVLVITGSYISLTAYRWSYSLEREVRNRTKKLKETSDYLNNLIRSANTPIVVWNPERRITIFNRAFEKMSGWQESEIVGESLHVIFKDDSVINALENARGVPKESMPEALELPIVRKDGQIRIGQWTSSSIDAENGEIPIATLAHGEDVTDRKRAEQALQKSEDRYRAVVEAQTELICRYTPDWILTFVNEAYCRYFDKKPWELIGSSFMPLIPEEFRQGVEERHRLLSDGDIPEVIHEHSVISGSGELKWQEWTNRAIFDDHNHLVEFQSVGRDITQLRKAEKELTKTLKNLAASQEMARLGSWEWNIDTDEIHWSDEVYRLFGWKPKEIKLKLSSYIERVHPDDLYDVRKAINDALAGMNSYESEHRIIRTDGEIRIHHTQGEVERDIHGKPVKLAGIVKDITERKRAEEEKRQLEAQLRHAQKIESMGALVAGAAHEINNPVNKIIYDIPLLKKIWRDALPALLERRGKEPEKKYGGLTYEFLRDNIMQLLSDMDLAANRVARTVSNLKDFTKKSSITDRKPMQVNTAVQNAVRLVHTTLDKSGIELKLDLRNDIPLIEGNLQSIEQIIMNVTINAIQSIDHDKGIIEITTGMDVKDRRVFISISDNGKGVDPAIADKIFDPFVTGRSDGEGTGLGLSITRNLVDAHGGEITFKSNKGNGTIFIISLPTLGIESLS